jgi:hypothetical protein
MIMLCIYCLCMYRRREAAALAVADAVRDWNLDNFDDAVKGNIYAVDMHEDAGVVMSTHCIGLVKVTSSLII